MNVLLHNAMHEQALWVFWTETDDIFGEDETELYNYFAADYVSVPADCRVNVGYVLH